MKTFIIITLYVACLNFNGQAQSPIKYILFDSIELEFDQYIEKYNNSTDAKISYYFLIAEDSENYRLSIIPYKENDNLGTKWVANTNRFVLINKNYYPIIFELDLKFGVVNETTGCFMKRNGNIKRAYIGGDYYSILFSKDGTILNKGF